MLKSRIESAGSGSLAGIGQAKGGQFVMFQSCVQTSIRGRRSDARGSA